MTCWAYYTEKKDEVPEDYLKHALDVVEYMVKSPLLNGIVKKVHYMTNVNKGLIKDLILISGLFHDIGKAWIKYQVENKALDFNGHEVISALVTLKALYEANLIKCEPRCGNHIVNAVNMMPSNNDTMEPIILNLTFMPILLHHYAFGSNQRIVNGYEMVSRVWNIQLTSECAETIKISIRETMNYIETEKARCVLKAIMEDVNDEVLEPMKIGEDVTRHLINAKVNIATSIGAAALSLLNEADGRVAMKNRRRASQPS